MPRKNKKASIAHNVGKLKTLRGHIKTPRGRKKAVKRRKA